MRESFSPEGPSQHTANPSRRRWSHNMPASGRETVAANLGRSLSPGRRWATCDMWPRLAKVKVRSYSLVPSRLLCPSIIACVLADTYGQVAHRSQLSDWTDWSAHSEVHKQAQPAKNFQFSSQLYISDIESSLVNHSKHSLYCQNGYGQLLSNPTRFQVHHPWEVPLLFPQNALKWKLSLPVSNITIWFYFKHISNWIFYI